MKSPEAPRVLSGKATRHLRSLGHHLQPLVQIGKDGLTDGIVKATERALLDHELVKVRVGTEAPDDRRETAEALAKQSGAQLVQVLGRTFLLYKRHPKKPQVLVPGGGKKAAEEKAAKQSSGQRRPSPSPASDPGALEDAGEAGAGGEAGEAGGDPFFEDGDDDPADARFEDDSDAHAALEHDAGDEDEIDEA